MRLIFATNNLHKIKEIIEILGEKYKDFVVLMSDLNITISPEENGSSFIENANIKSKALYEEMQNRKLLSNGDYIIADDSGLCIDALNGEPGIYSARYFGNKTNQEEKNLKILELMKDVADLDRKAHFITILSVIEVLDVVKNEIVINNFEGRVDGYITKKVEKSAGFGYDPIFGVGNPLDIMKNNVKTYENKGAFAKSEISHRAKAIHNFVLYLEKKHNI